MANRDFKDYMTGRGQQFNPYSAGNKRYGPEGRRGPNTGKNLDQSGYNERDNRARVLRNAALRKMKSMQQGKYASSDALRPLPRTPYKGRAGGY